MSALQQLTEHLKKIADLQSGAVALHQQAAGARNAVGAAEAEERSLAEIKVKRRGLLGRMFLGEDPEVNPGVLDADIKAAEKQTASVQARKEGAQSALEILNSRLQQIAYQQAELTKQTVQLRYEALVEQAQQTIPHFREALNAFLDAYSQVIGAHLAADTLADPQAGRVYIGGQVPGLIHLPWYGDVKIPDELIRGYQKSTLALIDDAINATNTLTKEASHGQEQRAA